MRASYRSKPWDVQFYSDIYKYIVYMDGKPIFFIFVYIINVWGLVYNSNRFKKSRLGKSKITMKK